MTVLLGVADGDVVLIGADSYTGYAWNGFSTPERKVVKRNGVIIAAAGQGRMFQALLYKVGVPEAPERDPYSWFYQRMQPAIREAAEYVGMEIKDNGEKWAGRDVSLLLSVCGRLFATGSGFSLMENTLGIQCDGVGGQVALGAMMAWQGVDLGLSVRNKMINAMVLSAKVCDGVRPPYYVVSSNDPDDEV